MNIPMIENQLIFSLILSVFVGWVGGYLGSLMISKRMSLAGDALGHVALPGIALALLFNFNPVYGAFASLIVGIILIWFLEIRTFLPTESLVGIVFTAGVAISFFLLKEEKLESVLIGDITKTSAMESLFSAVALMAVFFLLRSVFSQIILASVSEDLAKSLKIKTSKNNFIFLLSVAVVVALGIKVVGSLLIGALVIIPPAVVRNVGKNLKQYSYGSALLGSLVCLAGVWLSQIFNLPAGPLVIIVGAFFFLLSLVFSRKKK